MHPSPSGRSAGLPTAADTCGGIVTGADGGLRWAVVDAVGGLHVDRPGAGRTAARWLALHDLAVADVAVARLGEAHLDAMAILAEAGMRPRPAALYGVWASAEPGGSDVRLTGAGTGPAGWRLAGTKAFCSGIGIVDRALIDVVDRGHRQLVDADVRFLPGGQGWCSPTSPSSAAIEWRHPGLARCNTGTVTLIDAGDVDRVGPPGWYLDRVGFWHGACGPAACWAGGAAGLLAHAEPGDDPYRLAAAGAMAATAWTMRAVLQRAGDEIDGDPHDVTAARRRARALRHTVHEQASGMLDRFQRAWGPRPLVAGPGVAERIADVAIYLRQHHGDRDLAALARDTWPAPEPAP